MNRPLRPCAVAVIVDDKGRYLVGERADNPGAWQFPQGGVEAGEEIFAGLRRELSEEIGCDDVELIRAGSFTVDYLFPPDLDIPIAKRYRGQTQTWFLLRLNAGAAPDLSKADGEFRSVAWKDLGGVLAGIVPFKRQAYKDGLRSLGITVGES